MITPLLTHQNYRQGFLVDDELMAGVTQDPEQSTSFVAFVLNHSTGEYVGYQNFDSLESALHIINQIPRSWTFEKLGGCGSCGKEGGCSKGKCGAGGCGQKGSCSTNN